MFVNLHYFEQCLVPYILELLRAGFVKFHNHKVVASWVINLLFKFGYMWLQWKQVIFILLVNHIVRGIIHDVCSY